MLPRSQETPAERPPREGEVTNDRMTWCMRDAGCVGSPVTAIGGGPERISIGGHIPDPHTPRSMQWGGWAGAPAGSHPCPRTVVDPPTHRRASAISRAASTCGIWHSSDVTAPPLGLVPQPAFPPVPDSRCRWAVILPAARPRLRPAGDAFPAARVVVLSPHCRERGPIVESPTTSPCLFPIFSREVGRCRGRSEGGAEPPTPWMSRGVTSGLAARPTSPRTR